MRIFTETQRFRQWWLILIAGICILLVLGGFYFDTNSLSPMVFVFVVLVPILILFGIIFSLKLKTRIDQSGIWVQFAPLSFFSRYYKWHEIRECYVRQYSPISEYGGWGIRGFNPVMAYNVAGNMGIQIVTKSRQGFLVGTQKPREAQNTIDFYLKKQHEIEQSAL